MISRSLTVIDVKKVLREKDEISWLSSEWSLQYIFSNVAFLDYKPFLFYHNSILPKRQEHAQKQKVTTERVKAVKDKNRSKKKVGE